MSRETILKFVGFALSFFVIASFGHMYNERTDAEQIKITGVEYREAEEVIVEVSGEVKHPGKYSVEKGTSVHSLIYMAGGIKDDGDPESVDGDMVIFEPCTINVSKKTNYDMQAHFTHDVFSYDNPCNINTATKEELASLPLIGEVMADRIINYRKVNGKFKDKSQIQNVNGIGKSKYEKIKDIITVGGN